HCASMRVLVAVTYRATELLLGPHPFQRVKSDLLAKDICTELTLPVLGRRDVDSYLALAFPDHAFPGAFADLVYARTEGNPLFMADLVRPLREGGVIAQAGGQWALAHALPDLRRALPESALAIIQQKLQRLDEDDRRLLAAASVQGHEFDSSVVAGALGRDVADVEERLQELERVHALVRQVR